MKVLYCSGFPISLEKDIKGGGNWITNLINAIITYAPEIEPQLVIIDPNIKDIQFVNDHEIQIVKIPSFKNSKIKRLMFARGVFDPYQNLIEDFKFVIDQLKPDIVQIFGFESQFIRLIDEINIPICIHFQGYKEAIAYKINSNVLSNELRKNYTFKDYIVGNTLRLNKKSSSVTSYLNKAKHSNVEYVLGRTDWDRWITKLVSPKARYFYCQEIIRKEFFENHWSWPENRKFKLFTIAKNSVNKNIHIIVETIHLLEKHAPYLNFEWQIAGLKGQDSIPKLMLKKQRKSDKIRFLGNIGSHELINTMKESHLFVLPSAIENSPNSLQEAMVIGMPVLASYAGGVGSIIEHGKTGYLVPEGEPFSLAGAILELINNENLCVQLGRNAKETASTRNSPKIIFKQALNTYLEIVRISSKK